MTLRVFTEPQQGASYDQLLTVARLAEDSGFGAFFRSDHVLKMGNVSGLPGVTDAWITLAGLARDTSTIRLGTMVTPVTFRPLGMFAVTAAQVDQMSGGRVDVGIGAGWFEHEHAAFGVPFPDLGTRYDALEDQYAILHGAWRTPAGETFDYNGRSVSVTIAADTIRPAQQPGPPLIVGAHGGPRSIRLCISYADEYNVSFSPTAKMATIFTDLTAAAEKADRDPASIVRSVARVVCCGKDEAEIARRAAAIGRDVTELRENGLTGTPAEVLDGLATLADNGAERFYLQVLDLDDLDHLRLIADDVLPHAPGR